MGLLGTIFRRWGKRNLSQGEGGYSPLEFQPATWNFLKKFSVSLSYNSKMKLDVFDEGLEKYPL